MKKDVYLKMVYIRVKDQEDKAYVCSIHPDIYNTFFDVCKVHRTFFKRWLTKWAEEDFNWWIDFSEKYHIQLLKELVIDKYRCVYPHIHYNQVVTNEHFWLRVWMSEHMGREIRKHDRAKYNKLFKLASNCGSRF